jgi:hypothetical protein
MTAGVIISLQQLTGFPMGVCYMKRRQPPDVSSDDLNCILNSCDCSVVMVGGERLPSSSINSVLASPVFSHLCLLLIFLPFFPLRHGQEQEE